VRFPDSKIIIIIIIISECLDAAGLKLSVKKKIRDV
jgi:hypothetical protein